MSSRALPGTPVRASLPALLWRIASAPLRWRGTLIAIAAYLAVNAAVLAFEPALMRMAVYDRQFTVAHAVDYLDGSPPDIVFMGTSRVATGFDPAVAEQELAQRNGVRVRALNLGVTGGTIDLQYLLLKNMIRDDRKPKVIVYGLTEVELNSRLKSAIASLPYSSILLRPDDWADYGGATWEERLNFALKQVCPIYRDRDLIRNALSIRFNPDDPSYPFRAPGERQWQPPADGFYLIPPDMQDAHLRYEQNRTEYTPSLADFQVEGWRAERLRAFLALAHARGIKVILVNMPVTDTLRGYWGSDAAIESYLARVRALAQEASTPLLDLYMEAGGTIPTSGFLDAHHLNSGGAAALTRLVARDYLAEQFALPINLQDFYRAELSDLSVPERMVAGATYIGSVRLRNASGSVWPGVGDGSVRVAYHWRDLAGREVVHDGVRTLLQDVLWPGGRAQLALAVVAPPEPGEYILEVDALHEGVSWFGERGSPTLQVRVVVSIPR